LEYFLFIEAIFNLSDETGFVSVERNN